MANVYVKRGGSDSRSCGRETEGRSPNNSPPSMIQTFDRIGRAKGELVGCKEILAGIGEIACKGLQKAQDVAGAPDTPSIGIKSLSSSDGEKTPVWASMAGENGGCQAAVLRLQAFRGKRSLAGIQIAVCKGVAA